MMNTQNCFPKLVRQICVPLTLGCFAGSLAWLPAARAQSEQQFYDSVTVPTTNYVDDVAVGDLNNDGQDDVVTPYDVLLGNADGTFQTAKPTTFQRDMGGEMVLADFNGDGNLDLAVTIASVDFAFTNKVAVLLGKGDGTFQPEHDYVAVSYPFALAVADFNGDGIPDLVVGGDLNVGGSSSFAVLLGNGDGTFGQPIQSGEFTTIVAAADLNGDGKADVVVGNAFENQISIYFGNGDGTFQPPKTKVLDFSVFKLKLVDVNGDSRLDLIAGAYIENHFAILPGKPNGTFGAPLITELADMPGDFVAGDFDRDGKIDFAVSQLDASRSGQTALVILLGKGNGKFRPAIQFGSLGNFIAAGDFDHDATLDLVGGGAPGIKSLQVAYGRRNGKFTDRRDFAVGNGAWGVASADLNHDGNLDLAVGTSDTFVGSNTVTVLLGDGRGAFSAPTIYQIGGDYGSLNVAIGDLNGDGNPDLVANHVAYPNFGVDVLLGNGDGTFALPVDYPTGAYPLWVAIADVNNDGRMDIITADNTYTGNQFRGRVGVLLGNGDGTFQPYIEYATAKNPTLVVAADFNHDGNVDLATANGYYPYLPTSISILLGRGDGRFPTHTEYELDNLAEFKMVTGDFNGDGKIDLACSSGQLLLGGGDGTFEFGQPFASEGAFSIDAGDYNNDGKADLVTTDTASVLYFTGDGGGSFTQQPPLAVGYDPHAIVSGDFNRDHLVDVLTANFGYLNVSVLLNTGAK